MRWRDGLLFFVNYCLCEIALRYYLWPAISHFHHADVSIPKPVEVLVDAVAIPALAALLTRIIRLKRGLSLLPFALGPIAVGALVFIFGESELPRSWYEAFSITAVLLVAVVSASGGAYVGKHLVNARSPEPNEAFTAKTQRS